MWHKKGFTLIELMIVVAIIAIIAAISIPNLMVSRIAANETTAVAGLKILVGQAAIWREQDTDTNGIKDYWMGDVSCFYRWLNDPAVLDTTIRMIDVSFARADENAVAAGLYAVATGPQPGVALTYASKTGYKYRVLTNDEDGKLYLNSLVGGVWAANYFRFGFCASPDIHGSSGMRVFVVNQEGTIWERTATDQDDTDNVNTFPTRNPTAMSPPWSAE